MNKLILILILFVFTIQKSKSQIVFCPPGAEWNYVVGGLLWSPVIYNENIRYTRDSIISQDTVNILTHFRFYENCGPWAYLTLIKQKGDTVFMRNTRTQNTWQILYNFAALPQHSWQTTVLNFSTPLTYTITVDSVYKVIINGYSRERCMLIFLPQLASDTLPKGSNNRFLFPLRTTNTACDEGIIGAFLCYRDSTFGLHKLSELHCD